MILPSDIAAPSRHRARHKRALAGAGKLPAAPADSDLMTLAEARAWLRMKEFAFRPLFNAGEFDRIDVAKKGARKRSWRTTRSSLKAFVERRKVKL